MILDTTFLIDLLRNGKGTLEKAKELEKSYEPVLTTTITVFELWQGIKDTAKERDKIRRLLMSLGILSFDLESSFLAGDIQRNLAQKGKPIEPEDSMIAGIVLRNKETLLTKNVNHFKRVPELKVETY